MLKSLKLRAILILGFLLIAAVFLLPNFVELQGAWKEYLPSEKIHLGLDLQGGMRLLLQLDTGKMMEHLLDRKIDQLKDGMIREGIRFTAIDRKADGIEVAIKADQREKFDNLLGKELPDFKVSGNRAEGDTLYLDLSYTMTQLASIKDNAVHQALETIRNRIDQLGVSEPAIQQQGEADILVELPGIKEPERALALIGRTAQLEFKLVDEDHAASANPAAVPEGDELLPMRQRNSQTGVVTTGSTILVKKQAVLTGEMLTDAKVGQGGDFRNELTWE